jgi:peptidoglycan/xylan/chitin deacetylase (PgdA/CDA1 family)
MLDLQPQFVGDWFQQRDGVVFRNPARTTKRVALTIDDSPSENTGKILDVLQANKVSATFFIIAGHVAENHEIVQRIVREGHELGNHLLEDRAAYFIPKAEFTELFDHSQNILSEYTTVKWFRPPNGFYHNWMIQYAAGRGVRTALGSLHPYDSIIPSAEYSISQILRNTERGEIIVMHDGKNRASRTVDVLKRTLPELRERGLEITTLSGLFAEAPDGAGQ